jgi:pimeloyl-ACP methyl ester carboxylesterase
MRSKRIRASQQDVWNLDECTGELRSTGIGVGLVRLIPVPLNPDRERDGIFYLYYFVRMPDDPDSPNGSRKKRAEKTVLFCGGGPGDKIMPDDGEWWLDSLRNKSNGFNVVYFNLRGTGLSQIPPSSDFDKFLRTKYAVNDLERIRQDFLGVDKSWDAVIGHSYGCILAQQYAASEHGTKIEKLVLIAPPSNHLFTQSGPLEAYGEYQRAVKNIRTEIIDKVYGIPELERFDKEEIKAQLLGDGGIYDTIEKNFGSERFVIDAYDELRESGVLEDFGLAGLRLDFFEALRDLRNKGWSPLRTPGREGDSLKESGRKIGNGLKQRGNGQANVANQVRSESESENLYRVFYVIGTYDGTNKRFLKEWLARGKKDFRAALARTGGKAHVANGVNKHIGKVGVNRASIKSILPWDPARYHHNRPTLVLDGGADVVTAAHQAEHYFNFALTGYRVLVTFPGVGHDFDLPHVNPQSPILDDACQRGDVDAIDCVVASFTLLAPKFFFSEAKKLFGALEQEGKRSIITAA